MHPEDVAELVAGEVDDLEAALAGRPELPVTNVRYTAPTRIDIAFSANQQEAELVGQGLIVPGGAPGQFQQGGLRVPILGRSHPRPLILAVGCENWDGTPPTAELLLADGTPLPAGQWPQDPVNRGIVFGHPDYDRKFFCRPGLREYHTHPVHKDDPWDAHREGFSLAGLIMGLLDDLANRWTLRPP